MRPLSTSATALVATFILGHGSAVEFIEDVEKTHLRGNNERRMLFTEEEVQRYELAKEIGIFGTNMANVNTHFGDLWEPFDNSKDTPFFFLIPKSGTSTLNTYFAKCTSMVPATDLGGSLANDHVEIVDVDGHNYINVDTETVDGLEHAKEVGIAESAIADVFISGYPHHVARVFNDHNQARMFTMIRNPLQRTLSEYYYVQISYWEYPGTFKPWVKDWSIVEYVNSDIYVPNWLTRQLAGKSSLAVEITEDDLEVAKKVLARKCLIGLLDDYEESIRRFQAYFGWEHDEECLSKLLDRPPQNANSHPPLEFESEVWQALVDKNQFDMQIYSYAIELFERQAGLFFGDRAYDHPSMASA